MKRSQSARPYNKKRHGKNKDTISSSCNRSFISLDTDYTIKVSTGDRAFNGSARIKILGEHGIITIPLTQPGVKLFQSKASDLFTNRTTDVGKIKRITIEGIGIDQKNTWHVKKIQIIKGQHVYK